MLAQKTTQQALRRFAAGKPSVFAQLAGRNFAAPLAVATSGQMRPLTTQKLTPAESYKILEQQRLNRPNSPHLTIYKPQVTWILSSLNRITGIALSGGFYLFGAAYLVAPLFNWHLDTASMAAAFGAWPVLAKIAAKFTVSLPFAFHSWNGIRHLAWDTGSTFSNATIIKTGWTVVGLSFASALALAMY